jgi:hypothetical protein
LFDLFDLFDYVISIETMVLSLWAVKLTIACGVPCGVPCCPPLTCYSPAIRLLSHKATSVPVSQAFACLDRINAELVAMGRDE